MEHCPSEGKKKKKTPLHTRIQTQDPPNTQSLHKPQNQPHPQKAETKRKKEYDPKAWEKEISKTAS